MGEASCGTGVWVILWARFFLLLTMEQTADAASQVQCLNNYGFQGRRVDCQWHRQQALEGTLFYLNFSDALGLSSDLLCPLSAPPGAPGHLHCSAYGEEGEFTENDEYQVVLHTSSLGESHADLIFVTYKPRLHIACDPPLDLQSKCSDNKCRVHWKRPEAYEGILEDWQWELAFKAVQEPWEQARRRVFISSETTMHIEGFEFKSDRDYVARMRCKTPDENHHYGSHWSPWSSCVTWTAHTGGWQQLDASIYCLLCLGTLLLLLVLAFALFKRVQSSCTGSIPTPAAFFQPLHQARRGDVKGWAGPAPAEVAAALSPLSFLQLPPGAGSGPDKQTWGEELRGVVQEPEHLPDEYCILVGAQEGAAPVPTAWMTTGTPSGALPSSLPLQGRAEDAPGSRLGAPAALDGTDRDYAPSGEGDEVRPLFA